jgi:hypothetical protein
MLKNLNPDADAVKDRMGIRSEADNAGAPGHTSSVAWPVRDFVSRNDG